MTLSTIVKVSTFSQGVNGFKWLMKKGPSGHKLNYHKIPCGNPGAGDYQSGFSQITAGPFFPGKEEYRYVVDKENPNGYFEYKGGSGKNICYGLNLPTDAIPKEGGYELSVNFEAKDLANEKPAEYASTTVGKIFGVVPVQTAYTWDYSIPKLGGWRYYAQEGGVATVTGLTPKPVQGEEGKGTIGFGMVKCPSAKEEPTYTSPEGKITIPKDAPIFTLLGEYTTYVYQVTKDKPDGFFSYDGGKACFEVGKNGDKETSYTIVVIFFGYMGEQKANEKPPATVTYPELFGKRVMAGNAYTYTPGGTTGDTELCGALGCWTYYDGEAVLGTAKIEEVQFSGSAPKKCCGSK